MRHRCQARPVGPGARQRGQPTGATTTAQMATATPEPDRRRLPRRNSEPGRPTPVGRPGGTDTVGFVLMHAGRH
ncbi:Protein of unknown function [Micromonospora lupini str. Lupac 08]|uniref:Uncharacterized protein n=1 Tax=Micromonospora lupini str. Lupac 08 TaxID=1150864 RepID=I0L706_9ACTN|nr:Protein of unknown function [Micromonospora lupini str. Lupac 08]